MKKDIVTRFAPSPTGSLHIGSARTAIFNWLFIQSLKHKKQSGKFLLRIEDTDEKRNSKVDIDNIINGMKWLGICHDDKIVFQSKNRDRHIEIAKEMIARNKAYYCYSTSEEVSLFRRKNPYKKFHSPWRDLNIDPRSVDAPHKYPSIRLMVKRDGSSIRIDDKVQGSISISNNEIDDMILVRSNGTPTYMLATVVDDYDMGVNYIIRGDDHLTNSFRQVQIYRAMEWNIPEYAHISLIHTENGKKLSKRHNAKSLDDYRNMGYLPESLFSYLLNLGWSCKDDNENNIISIDHAKKIFSINNIIKSPAKLDIAKLNHINSYYISKKDNSFLLSYIFSYYGNKQIDKSIMTYAIDIIKSRSVTLLDVIDNASIFINPSENWDEKTKSLLVKQNLEYMHYTYNSFFIEIIWKESNIKNCLKNIAKEKNINMKLIMQLCRAMIVRTFNSPDIISVLYILGKNECLKRILDIINHVEN